jgi:hypothetical protein
MTPSELKSALDRKAAEIAVTLEITKHLEEVRDSLLDHTVSANDFRKMQEQNRKETQA